MDKKQKILIVSWCVFPLHGATAILVHNLANALGHDNVVVVGEKSNSDSTWDVAKYPLYYVDPGIPFFSRGKQYFKWISLFFTVRKILQIAKQNQCTSILCPFPDEYYLTVSYLVSKKSGLTFYPWLHNTYLENRTGIQLKLAKFLQPRIFDHARLIFTISDGLTSYYYNNYKSHKFHTLLHCFNIPKIKFNEIEFQNIKKVKFAYTGSFNESCGEASVRLCKIIIENPKYELHVFGKATAQKLIENGILQNDMIVYGFLNDNDFMKHLQNCHIMLLPHGFTGAWNKVEFDTIFPTRTIPLLYSGRPILLHSPANVFLTNFFITHECGYVATSTDKTRINDIINSIIEDSKLREDILKNAIKISENYNVNHVKDNLFELI